LPAAQRSGARTPGGANTASSLDGLAAGLGLS